MAYAVKSDLETAEKHVAAAYSDKPDLKDGYARCAWQYYWPLKQYDKVIEWMEKRQSGSPSVAVKYALQA